jgi:hypothetical protein
MTHPTAVAPSPAPPAQQLAGFLSRFDPSIVKTVRAGRVKLRKLLPGAVELVYDNYNALAIAFSPTLKPTDGVVGLAIYPRWVNLYFMRGAGLPDPKKLLRGSGSLGRFLTLSLDAAELDSSDVRALLRAAIREDSVPLPWSARPSLVIRSVSRKQRPRRAKAGSAR